MSSLPNSLQQLINFFEKLPSVGPKTAKRLGFYLLRMPERELEDAAKHLINLKKNALYCTVCFNLTENTICAICDDAKREQSTITVVEDVLDLLSFEAGNQYQGVYHVLHGRIDPLNYIGPEDIFIQPLLERITKNNDLKEIILATNPNMEGEATAIFIRKKIREMRQDIKITRLAYGLPIGADLEYADYMTLARALEGRRDF